MSDERSGAAAAGEHEEFARFMEAVKKSDPVWQDKVLTAFTSSVSTRDWALMTEQGREVTD